MSALLAYLADCMTGAGWTSDYPATHAILMIGQALAFLYGLFR